MEIWLDIEDSPISRNLTTLNERVSFQVSGTVLALEQETIDVSSPGKPAFTPGRRRARIYVDTIQQQNEGGMTADREQIRLGAIAAADARSDPRAADLANWCLALLDELEQAEKSADEYKTGYIAAIKAELVTEARLAKVPALVEALRMAISWEENWPMWNVDDEGWRAVVELSRNALAAWEQTP